MSKEMFAITTGAGENKKELWNGEVDFDAIMSTLKPEIIQSLAKAQLKIKARAVGLAVLNDEKDKVKDVAGAIENQDWNVVGTGGARIPEFQKTIRYILEAKGVRGKDKLKEAEAALVKKYNSDENVRTKIDALTEQRKNMFNI